MKPNQRAFLSGVGNLALTAGTIFIGWKMISSAFKLIIGSDKDDAVKKKKDREWLGIPTAIFFGTEVLTGESPMNLIKG